MARGLLLEGHAAVVASLVALLVAAPLAAQTSSPGQTGQPGRPTGRRVFKSGVDLVTVSATVRDRRGRAVAD